MYSIYKMSLGGSRNNRSRRNRRSAAAASALAFPAAGGAPPAGGLPPPPPPAAAAPAKSKHWDGIDLATDYLLLDINGDVRERKKLYNARKSTFTAEEQKDVDTDGLPKVIDRARNNKVKGMIKEMKEPKTQQGKVAARQQARQGFWKNGHGVFLSLNKDAPSYQQAYQKHYGGEITFIQFADNSGVVIPPVKNHEEYRNVIKNIRFDLTVGDMFDWSFADDIFGDSPVYKAYDGMRLGDRELKDQETKSYYD